MDNTSGMTNEIPGNRESVNNGATASNAKKQASMMVGKYKPQ